TASFSSLFAILLILSLDIAYAQTNATSPLPRDGNSLLIMVNLERIRNQILLSEKSLAFGDIDTAFAHSYIPHSVIFPSIKDQLNAINSQSRSQLESLLTDLPINIRAGEDVQQQGNLLTNLRSIERLLDNISNQTIGQHLLSNQSFIANTIVYLLRDADQSYRLSNATTTINQQFSKVDYENAQGLLNISKSNYEKIADSLDQRRRQEIDSFFVQLENSIEQRNNVDETSQLVSAIERDLAEYLSLGTGSQGISPTTSEHSQYFTTIRNLMSDVINEVKQNGDYRQADKAAMTAYLDNYEYLEAPIEMLNATLMEDIEIDMREELRDMLKEEQPIAAIENFVDGILVKLSTAEQLLNSDASIAGQNQTTATGQSRSGFADIEGLSQGFGTYTGERRQMGEADDPAKTAVRSDIDQIRVKLDDSLELYKLGEAQEALTTARSAYLDSYEKVEIPLRPIDPDFTLDMEIKFAELRNLIQSNAGYEEVLKKTSEIKSGLDESERLVSGTGIIAPSIAFSTSFSIIFREGLESALIIGAIITYLEASRNQRFKKHVYYGIIVAVGATAVTWFIAQYIIEISGASRELIEAIAGISAVAVLFWVSFWVLNKIETKRWIEFVKAKVWKATTTGSVLVFIMLSFFTVYREGFETVLFYQAILGFARYMEWYVIAGMVLGLAVIIGVALGVRKLGRKLPLRVLFGLTMGIGAYMSIAFMGNAIREFQEVGYIPTTHMIGTIPRLDINLATMTGIHPTLETVVAQLILLSVYIVGSLYILILQPRKKKTIEASRKSMADLEKKGSTSSEKY
ncbi:MAG TPA: FTR1 family protein, partial [Nitrososphaeraceae archaeon]|nr:FTR1 family protein [Nitrososphaeraceae archaeon]